MMKLKNKVCIITGAGSGIGRETALLFAREGSQVLVADWDKESGEKTVKVIREMGYEASYIKVDVSKANDARLMIEYALEKYGKLDILFNNAGVNVPKKPITEVSEKEWDHVINVNLKGVFLGSKYAVRAMLDNKGGGTIINTASNAGIVGRLNYAAYSASKGGVVMFTKSLALECAPHNIRVNCICPGAVLTGMTQEVLEKFSEKEKKEFTSIFPLGRIGLPGDIAHAALYLASEESSYVTGVVLPVDGGWTDCIPEPVFSKNPKLK